MTMAAFGSIQLSKIVRAYGKAIAYNRHRSFAKSGAAKEASMKSRVILGGLGAIALCASSLLFAQAPSDASRAITDGGVFAPGWTGQIDANEAKRGMVLANAKLSQDGAVLHITTGPATTYWNPKDVATGNYTVKATFNESKYMNLNSHPHPYGLFIGGNDLGTPQATYLYCEAY